MTERYVDELTEFARAGRDAAHAATDAHRAPPARGRREPCIKFHATRHKTTARLTAAAIFVGSVGVLSVAAWLEPDPSGLGSHRQLGLPRCTAITLTGYPCPTCGMTTAFTHTVRGQVVAAFIAQPAGLALAIATIVAGVGATFTLLTGQVPAVNSYRVPATWVVVAITAMILGGWVFKLAAGVASGTLPAGSMFG